MPYIELAAGIGEINKTSDPSGKGNRFIITIYKKQQYHE